MLKNQSNYFLKNSAQMICFLLIICFQIIPPFVEKLISGLVLHEKLNFKPNFYGKNQTL